MKRRFGTKKRCLPPSRALLAEIGDRKETATWVCERGAWKCFNATGALKWMQGSVRPLISKAELTRLKISWEWLVPLFARQPLAPPF